MARPYAVTTYGAIVRVETLVYTNTYLRSRSRHMVCAPSYAVITNEEPVHAEMLVDFNMERTHW